MKKLIKLFFSLVLCILLSAPIFSHLSFAYDKINPDDYNPSNYQDLSNDNSTITKLISAPASALTTFGIVISVIALMIVGLKYILGSVNEKAEYKKNLWPIILGIFIIALILSIIRIFIAIGTSINTA